DGQIWYSSYYRDIMGRVDPASGKVVEYPMPYTDNGMRDFFVDKDGRMWFGTPPNNRVGYFYISNKQRNAEVRSAAAGERAPGLARVQALRVELKTSRVIVR